MSLPEITQKRPTLVKHNAAIHCSNSTSLLQRKISNALLYHAYDNLLTKREHEIEMAYLCRLIGYSGHNYSAIKDAFKQLIATVIEWNLVDREKEEEDWTACSLLSCVSIKGPVCRYEYNERLAKLFYEPSLYSRVNMVVQSKFRSNYGLALYENTVRFRALSFTKWFDLDMFRKLMGIPEGKYSIFRDLKKRVIDKSIDEVNKYSDITVEPEFQRSGRRVVGLRFKIKDRKKRTKFQANIQQTTETSAKSPECEKVLLSDFGLSVKQIGQLFTNYSEQYIQEKIAVVQASKSYREGRIGNLAKYLLKAVEDDWAAPKAQLTQEREFFSSDEVRPSPQYDSALEETISSRVEALGESEKMSLMHNFEQYITKTSFASLYTQSGLDNPLTRLEFTLFVKTHFPALVEEIDSAESD